MSEISYTLWLNQFVASFKNKSSQNCVEFFDCDQIQISQMNQIRGLQNDTLPKEIVKAVQNQFNDEKEISCISQTIKGYLTMLKTQQLCSNSNKEQGYSQLFHNFNQQCFQPFYKEVLQTDFCDGMWIAPFLDHMAAILCKLAMLADTQDTTIEEKKSQKSDEEDDQDDEDNENKHIKLAQQEMNKLNQQLRSGKQGYDSRKYGQFFIQVRIVRVWFKLYNYKLCNAIFQTFEQTLNRLEIKWENLPVTLTTVFFYFKGRYHLYNNEYQQARINLQMALQLSQSNSNVLNQRKVLTYLIPAEMQVGKFPAQAFLKQHNLERQYHSLSQACINGNILQLEEQIQINQQEYIQSGVYLALEKLRHLTLRNFFKKIAIAMVEKPQELQNTEYMDKPNIIPLKIPFRVLVKWDNHLDMDELESILANLIAMGYIKGYISHDLEVLVLAKEIEKAFPREAFSEKAND